MTEKRVRTQMYHRKEGPSLTKIILALVIVAGAVAGVLRFSSWFSEQFGGGGEVEATPAPTLADAESFAAQDNPEEAQRVLTALVESGDAGSAKALLLRGELLEKQGDGAGAKETYRRVMDEFANAPEQPVASLGYARIVEKEGAVEEALAIYTRIAENAPPEIRAGALSGLARNEERENKRVEARDLYRRASNEAAWGGRDWEEGVEGLGRLNVAMIFDTAQSPESKFYTTQAGDSITNIGIKLNTTQGLLMRANGMTDPNRLRLNQMLKYTPKDFRIVIERSTCRLFLLDSEGTFKVYTCGLGKEGRTTLGQYKIGDKEKDPIWWKPGSAPIQPGAPENELGSRWMPLVPEAEGLPNDLGIHGTIRPETIGQYASMGCPRLMNAEVEELYDLVVRSTPVSIVEVFSPGRGD